MKNRDHIFIEGANQNNLKNVTVEIPKDKIVVVTGVSGSGKSTLAFDTLYAEGYRRYVENLSSNARFFLNAIKKPKVRRIENLSPAIAIDQKNNAGNPRSTVGTMTDIYDFLRVLFSEAGTPFCPECGKEMKKQSEKEIVDAIKKFGKGTQVVILAPWNVDGSSAREKLSAIENQRFARVRVDGKIMTLLEARQEIVDKEALVEVVVDRMMLDGKAIDQERIVDSLQTAAKISKSDAKVVIDGNQELIFSKDYQCPGGHASLKKISAKNFSFNSPDGACEKCSGLGVVSQVDVNKVVPNKKLSLAEGALVPWSRTGGRNGGDSFMNILSALGKKYAFSLNDPVEKITSEKMDKIFYGTGDEEVEILDKNGNKQKMKFAGLVDQLEDKYHRADSSFVRNELEKYFTSKICPDCQGKRLKKIFLNVKVFNRTIDQWVCMEASELLEFLKQEFRSNKDVQRDKAIVIEKIVPEIICRLEPLVEIGLDYISLDRSSQTLSGGEFQRTRLATQLYSGLGGVIYVLDEPSIGLHARDTDKLIDTFKKIKNRGNSVIVVEHDKDVINAADYLIDLGPGAGCHGGEIIFQGTVDKLKQASTETSAYIFGRKTFKKRKEADAKSHGYIAIKGATHNNLKNINVDIPLGKLVSVVGVSGGGKSSLINDILAKELRNKVMGSLDEPGDHRVVEGIDKIDKVVIVDQSPIGRTPRSNPATYTGVFNHIRKLFSETEVAKKKRLTASHFSFNMRGGRCEYCQGEGSKKIEMHLLDDVFAVCSHCDGKRYSAKVLEVQYHGVSIADVLNMNIEYAYNFFNSQPLIAEKLKALCDVGLGYLRLGQSATELSGGEAQRIKLANELSRKSTGKTFYILDEPTIGLHYSDIAQLLSILHGLVDKGNSVIIVEHNLDVINVSDWAIEIGPEGGRRGGLLVFEGRPEDLKKADTPTGKILARQ